MSIHYKSLPLKVTVQFETEGNGQNEIASNMDRSEVKLSISEKYIVISHIQNEILKQKNFTGSEFEGAPKRLKAFFYFYVKTMRHSRFQLGQFFVHWFEIWRCYS